MTEANKEATGIGILVLLLVVLLIGFGIGYYIGTKNEADKNPINKIENLLR